MRSVLQLILILLVGWSVFECLFGVTHLDLAPDAPLQVTLTPGKVAPWTYHGCIFTPLATYNITARILHRCAYPPSSDQFALVCPLDLALGWGRMSDPTVYDQLEIGQINRFYRWQNSFFSASNALPIPEDEIIRSSANTHVIPANNDINDQLFSYSSGDVIKLTGYLVGIVGPDGWNCRSSLIRTDIGPGACEIMWVNEAAKIGR